MAKIKVGVCELPSEMSVSSAEWDRFCESVSLEAPHLFLLNEMPFGEWIAAGEQFDERVWRGSLAAHDEGMSHLSELGASIVAGTRPRATSNLRVNEAFLGTEAVHTKQYFPDEEGYYEARWFQAGERHFRLAAGALQCGFLICTELMFNEHARRYGREGAHVILVPRATGGGSLDRWLVATRMAAMVSGAYVISSNRAGTDSRGQRFGGSGWIVDPIGNLVAQTSAEAPVVFHEIDTDLVAQAQRDYPCYVKE